MKIAAPLSHDCERLLNIVGGLSLCFDESLILAWDIKPLFSFFKAITGADLNLGRIWDLKIIEKFYGIEGYAPKTVEKALSRLAKLPLEGFSSLYNQVYYPLITTVIPQMEATGVAHRGKKKILHPFFEIEEHANGRLKCRKAFYRSYLPHNLSSEDKENLAPVDYDDVFVYFDFKSYEVAVLQWLSGDIKLGKALSSGNAYEYIWSAVTSLQPDTQSEKRGKLLFLPMIFGLGPRTLAKDFKIDEKTARELINRFNHSFPTAFTWIESQGVDDDNYATDHFGRRRKIEQGNEYLVRNFSVQAPASIISLKKLVKLHEKTKDFSKLCFHLHDGFCILVNKGEIRRAANIGTEVLEAPDNLFPDLKLKVSCVWGRRLDQLKTI